ncbi:MAG: hypothetical protein HQ594_03235 [Candidatus Omnitrophica bacterium]|nr:hypothetical protein [Candidatus Omnitrophota bacterium]
MSKKIKYIILFSVLVFASAISQKSIAEDQKSTPIELKAVVDKEEVYIGDRIKFTVTAYYDPKYEVLFPVEPENLGDFTFVESLPSRFLLGEKGSKGRKLSGYEYVLTVYETGLHIVPPVKVKYKTSKDADWLTTESPKAAVEVLSLLTGSDKDIKDIKGLIVFNIDLSKIFIVLLVLAVCLVIWFLWRRRKRRIEEELRRIKPAHEIAYEELRELKKMDLPAQGRIKEYYFILSDIIRRYLENRFAFRAPEMTTEEFMQSIKKSPKLADKHKELLKEFLFRCDMVKFAKYGPTPLEMLDSFKAAETLVDETRFVEEDTEG